MKQKIIFTIFAAITILFSASCSDTNEDIIKYHKTATEAAEVCGIKAVEFIPEGYEVLSYKSVYGVVFEAEFAPYEKNRDAQSDMAQIAVFRIADAKHNVTNLSGFSNTVSSGIYSHIDGREFEIMTRDGVYMCEWKEAFGEKECNISYTVFGNDMYANKDALENYKTMLCELLEHLNK